MKSQEKRDLSRAEELESIISRYMEIGIELLQEIESDHLWAMY